MQQISTFFLDECLYIMLYYDRNDVSEGIDVKKTSASKECGICQYLFVSTKRLKSMSGFINDFCQP